MGALQAKFLTSYFNDQSCPVVCEKQQNCVLKYEEQICPYSLEEKVILCWNTLSPITHHCTAAKGIWRGQEKVSVIGCVEKYLDVISKEKQYKW